MSTIVPILFCFWVLALHTNCCETTKQKTFSKKLHYRQDKLPFFVMVIKKEFFLSRPLITEYTAEQVHNPRMSECRTPRRWSSQEVMDKLFGAINDPVPRMVADPAR